jgi:hypothetical protein
MVSERLHFYCEMGTILSVLPHCSSISLGAPWRPQVHRPPKVIFSKGLFTGSLEGSPLHSSGCEIPSCEAFLRRHFLFFVFLFLFWGFHGDPSKNLFKSLSSGSFVANGFYLSVFSLGNFFKRLGLTVWGHELLGWTWTPGLSWASCLSFLSGGTGIWFHTQLLLFCLSFLPFLDSYLFYHPPSPSRFHTKGYRRKCEGLRPH